MKRCVQIQNEMDNLDNDIHDNDTVADNYTSDSDK